MTQIQLEELRLVQFLLKQIQLVRIKTEQMQVVKIQLEQPQNIHIQLKQIHDKDTGPIYSVISITSLKVTEFWRVIERLGR